MIFNVTSVFYSILEQRHVIDSVKFSRKTLKEHLEQVENLLANERATKADRFRTEARLADVREQLATERNLLEIKRHTLKRLLGLDNSREPLSPQGTLESPASPVPDRATALTAAYKARDDLRAIGSKYKARQRNVEIARAERWPDVALEATYGPRWDASQMNDPEDAGAVGVGVRLPLFEGGRIQANVNKQKAEMKAARERVRELKLQIQLEVETAINDIASAQERVQASQKAIRQAKESLRIERLKYRNGTASITDMLDAQDQLLRSQRKHYHALADFNRSLASLRLAIGKEPPKSP